MLEAVEVATCDRRQSRGRDPREERVAVEELEAVDERRELRPATEGCGAARSARELLRAIRVGCDERRTVRTGGGERRLEAGRGRDVVAQPDGDDVSGLERIGIV